MRRERFRNNRWYARSAWIVLFFFLFTIHSSPIAMGLTSKKWQGVDESVVERVAKEHGREAKTPLINTDQGDLLLFFFLLAGVIGGFAAGYYWRVLTEIRGNQGNHHFSALSKENTNTKPAQTSGGDA
jgi:cobalt/nickel transport protein